MGLDILNEKSMIWISKNRSTFILVVLLSGNMYQYLDRKAIQRDSDLEKKNLNEKIQQISKETMEYERVRSEKLEYLLNNLPKTSINEDAESHHSR
jgi:hypothetical protein